MNKPVKIAITASVFILVILFFLKACNNTPINKPTKNDCLTFSNVIMQKTKEYFKDILPTVEGEKKEASIDELIATGLIVLSDVEKIGTVCTGNIYVTKGTNNYHYSNDVTCGTCSVADKYTAWSDWSENEPSEDENIQTEVKVLYNYGTSEEKFTEWSGWNLDASKIEEPKIPSGTTAVKTETQEKEQYSYRDKTYRWFKTSGGTRSYYGFSETSPGAEYIKDSSTREESRVLSANFSKDEIVAAANATGADYDIIEVMKKRARVAINKYTSTEYLYKKTTSETRVYYNNGAFSELKPSTEYSIKDETSQTNSRLTKANIDWNNILTSLKNSGYSFSKVDTSGYLVKKYKYSYQSPIPSECKVYKPLYNCISSENTRTPYTTTSTQALNDCNNQEKVRDCSVFSVTTNCRCPDGYTYTDNDNNCKKPNGTKYIYNMAWTAFLRYCDNIDGQCFNTSELYSCKITNCERTTKYNCTRDSAVKMCILNSFETFDRCGNRDVSWSGKTTYNMNNALIGRFTQCDIDELTNYLYENKICDTSYGYKYKIVLQENVTSCPSDTSSEGTGERSTTECQEYYETEYETLYLKANGTSTDNINEAAFLSYSEFQALNKKDYKKDNSTESTSYSGAQYIEGSCPSNEVCLSKEMYKAQIYKYKWYKLVPGATTYLKLNSNKTALSSVADSSDASYMTSALYDYLKGNSYVGYTATHAIKYYLDSNGNHTTDLNKAAYFSESEYNALASTTRMGFSILSGSSAYQYIGNWSDGTCPGNVNTETCEQRLAYRAKIYKYNWYKYTGGSTTYYNDGEYRTSSPGSGWNKEESTAKWGDWSAYNDSKVNSSTTREVRTQKLFRLRKSYVDSTTLNLKEFLTLADFEKQVGKTLEEFSKDPNVKIHKKVLYRYRLLK